jgi:hypothetical protein
VKFLTDSNVRFSLVELLRKLDHQVALADEQGFMGDKEDWRLVSWVRIHNHVLLTHDEFRGDSGLQVAQELRMNGGRVIYIAGGPEQEPERALGKLYFHWHEWQDYFKQEDGIVHLQDTRRPLLWFPRSQLQPFLRPMHVPIFEAYVERMEAAKKRPLGRSHKRRRAREQAAFDETLGMNGG